MWIFLLLCLLCLPASAQSHLDEIVRRGWLRVGTPGDYAPFSQAFEDGYQGFDIDLAILAARKLGVKVEWVVSPWGCLLEDVRCDRYDLAVGGITITPARALQVAFTRPLFSVGKVPLVRQGEQSRYAQPAEIDQPAVRLAFNPGGTNESYARSHFSRAQLVSIADNLSIPERLARGEVDVFVTDSLEAQRAARKDPRLAVAAEAWTQESLAWMAAREDQDWLEWLNLFLEECDQDGTLARLRRKHEL